MNNELKARMEEAHRRFNWWMTQTAIGDTDKLLIAIELYGVTKNLSTALQEAYATMDRHRKQRMEGKLEHQLHGTEARLRVAVEAMQNASRMMQSASPLDEVDPLAEIEEALAKIKEMEGSDE